MEMTFCLDVRGKDEGCGSSMRSGIGVGEDAVEDADGGAGGRPAGIESEMGDQLDQLVAGDAVVERPLQVEGQLVDSVERDEARNGDQAAVARREAGPLPDVSEQHLVG